MVQKYDVVLDSPLGQRFGTLLCEERGGRVQGTLSLLGFDNPVSGQCRGEILEFTHKLRTAVGILNCRTLIQLHGDELSGSVTSARCCMELHGRRTERNGIQDEIPTEN